MEEHFVPTEADALHVLFWRPRHATFAALPSAGIRSSGNNVLLHGPPGTGKTTIAQAASQESGATFYSVIPSSILSKYQGEPCRWNQPLKGWYLVWYASEDDSIGLTKRCHAPELAHASSATSQAFPIRVRDFRSH